MSEFPEHGLLARVADEEVQWLRPDFKTANDRIAAAFGWVQDIGESTRVVIPAAVDGLLQPPPAAHVLDSLVRDSCAHLDAPEVQAEFYMHPAAGTVAVVRALPLCDFCQQDGVETAARYDGPATAKRDAPWANMCPACYRSHSTGRLGLGEGQYLLLRSEVPADLHVACQRAIDYWSDWARHATG